MFFDGACLQGRAEGGEALRAALLNVRAKEYFYFGAVQEMLKLSTPEREGEKILDALKGFRGRVYAMSEEGKQFDSRGFSKRLEEDLLSGGSAFAVGGPYGLSADVKGRADVLMSMSNMTFTHEFARAILLEQIYRAKTISANTGYHH